MTVSILKAGCQLAVRHRKRSKNLTVDDGGRPAKQRSPPATLLMSWPGMRVCVRVVRICRCCRAPVRVYAAPLELQPAHPKDLRTTLPTNCHIACTSLGRPAWIDLLQWAAHNRTLSGTGPPHTRTHLQTRLCMSVSVRSFVRVYFSLPCSHKRSVSPHIIPPKPATTTHTWYL